MQHDGQDTEENGDVDPGQWDVEAFDPASYEEPPVDHEEVPPEEDPDA